MSDSLERFVLKANKRKDLYTAGPSSLLPTALECIEPCFGRNDHLYAKAEDYVLSFLKSLTSHKSIIRLQGSATLAIEIALLNFCRGNFLVIRTGYYSDRIVNILEKNKDQLNHKIDYVDYNNLKSITGKKYNWIISCYTETSCAFKVDLDVVKELALKSNAFLFLDATASIGLEQDHHLADVICYSSCKGLFGITGASFIAHNYQEFQKGTNSLYLDIETHNNHGVTGPYHQILSLYGILQKYETYRERVLKWQRCFNHVFKKNLVYQEVNQPILCTLLDRNLKYLKKNPIPYQPRSENKGDIVCHIGQVHRELNSINNKLIKSHFDI